MLAHMLFSVLLVITQCDDSIEYLTVEGSDFFHA